MKAMGRCTRSLPRQSEGYGTARSSGQGELKLRRARRIGVGVRAVLKAEMFEDLAGDDAVLDDGDDLVAPAALATLEDMAGPKPIPFLEITISGWEQKSETSSKRNLASGMIRDTQRPAADDPTIRSTLNRGPWTP